ncbi:MAG: glycosyltransferase [Nitrospirae bacterium]|nr:glycosyltransferase [Nitrospirota bacterium]
MTTANQPLVTIIMPTYNRVAFLEKSILNVLNQTYQNIELIVMDNASTDGSVEILNQVSKCDKRMMYVSEKDSGEVDATNKGITLASGDIIGFKASDDFYVLDAIEQAVNFLENNSEYCAVSGDALFIDKNGNFLNRGMITYRGVMDKAHIKHVLMFRQGGFTCHSCFFVQRNAIAATGYFDPLFSLTPDFEFCMRLLSNGYKIGCIRKILVHYTIHEDAGAIKYRKGAIKQNRLIRNKYNWSLFNETIRISIGRFISYCSNRYRTPIVKRLLHTVWNG